MIQPLVELLDLTVERVRRLPVLLVITFRPEFQSPWSGRFHVTTLALNRLGERDGAVLAQELAGNVLTADIVAEIVERTDGVPLFVEELTKTRTGKSWTWGTGHVTCCAIGPRHLTGLIDGSFGSARASG